jgi:hypothetical protein
MENIFWTGYSKFERHACIGIIKDIVSKYGSIIDYKFFSDISITLVIEIEERHINQLYEELSNYMSMDEFERLNSNTTQERTIYLNSTFTGAKGNLKIDVPAVPG